MPTTTTAAVARPGADTFSWETVHLEDPRPDELLVRLAGAGLCHTDLSVLAGKLPTALPAVLGHEGVGVVEAVGSRVTAAQPGDQVLLTFTSCGHCAGCRRGRPTQCSTFFLRNFSGTREDGSTPIHGADGTPLGGQFFGQSALAHHAVVSERSVVRVTADDQELPLLAPIGCGVQTGAGAILNVLKPAPGDTVAVFGAGAVGLSAVMAARLTGASRIVAVDIVPARLELALELGASDAINSADEDPLKRLAQLCGETGVTQAVETTGVPAVLEQAIAAIASNGTVAVIGAPAAGSRASFDINALIDGRTIRGVTEGGSDRVTFVPALLDLHRRGRLPYDKLVRFYTPEQIDDAVADARSGRTLKPVIRFAD
ncbi:NAD(P)-dependent alcohol dehydrogenase [Streptomyces sp. NPDC020801]|uniref:NAD(P)-dependent alcohol dehydrogenase n=1 Tax=unclassified Streptomyces TaxID=2593676 RepID=UPI0037ACDF66